MGNNYVHSIKATEDVICPHCGYKNYPGIDGFDAYDDGGVWKAYCLKCEKPFHFEEVRCFMSYIRD